MFRRQGGAWFEQAIITSPTPRYPDEFGISVSISSGTGSFPSTPTAIIGAPFSILPGGGYVGGAFIFSLTDAGFIGPLVAAVVRVIRGSVGRLIPFLSNGETR